MENLDKFLKDIEELKKAKELLDLLLRSYNIYDEEFFFEDVEVSKLDRMIRDYLKID